ncbi:zinc finger protein 345-like isoform X2 [Pungitius pungitius]|uniref:zinc finger protein 345-like isoform X2 n=1 Tax=Pungitius pungitius TaxID=134920 RepID=UPI002E0E3386
MSTGGVLRGVVARRLAAASREILALVDRIVAAYEEEASGFRREIDRQEKQLELLRGGADVRSSGGPPEEEEEEEEKDEEEEQPENLEDSTDEAPSSSRGQKPGRPQDHLDLRIRILEDSRADVLSTGALKRCPALRLRCPRGLREPDFLDLLRSSFPQQCGGAGRFEVLTSDRRRRLRPLRVTALTAEEINRSAGGSGGKSTLYIRLKTKTEPQTGEKEADPPQAQDAAGLQTSLVQEVQGSEEDASLSSVSHHPDVETEEADVEGGPTAEPAGSKGRNDDGEEGGGVEEEEEEANHSGEDSKPDGSGLALQPETTTRRKARRSGAEKTKSAASCTVCGAADRLEEKQHDCSVCRAAFAQEASPEDRRRLKKAGKPDKCPQTRRKALKRQLEASADEKAHLCGVCGKSLSDYRSLARHKMTHSGERPHGCQTCGRRFKLPGTLRQHEKIHAARERSHLCDVCCKMFLTAKQLQIHLRTHSEEKPYRCGECGRGFTTKGPLTIHMRVHTGEAPYRCPDCGWAFKRKINLDNHVTIHSGLKPFVCGICGKACARKSYLTVHMRTHNGERPYKCLLCDKAFTQSHCLKTHMKSHEGAT